MEEKEGVAVLQTLVTGLSIGGIYALMAVGYSLVFSVLNFSNFAHGAVIMLGAYIEVTQCLHPKTVEQMLSHLFTGAKANLVALNKEALRQGAACILKAAS